VRRYDARTPGTGRLSAVGRGNGSYAGPTANWPPAFCFPPIRLFAARLAPIVHVIV